MDIKEWQLFGNDPIDILKPMRHDMKTMSPKEL